MDSVVKSVLEYIQKQEGHQFSVLAGGALRDEHFGLVPKDYDLFVPSSSPRQMEELKNSMIKDLGIEDVVLKGTQYESLEEHSGQKITGVYGFFYADKEFDLIGVKEEDDGDFGDEVINKFDYGINMLWHDGITKYESMRFQDDFYGRRMTLHNIKTIDALPQAMRRFDKFNEKLGGGFRFYCPKLTLKGEEKEKPWSKLKKSIFVEDTTGPGWGEAEEAIVDTLVAENPVPPIPTTATQIMGGWGGTTAGTGGVWTTTNTTAQAAQGNTFVNTPLNLQVINEDNNF